MVRRGKLRVLKLTLLALLLLSVAAASVSAQGECSVDVSPAVGPAGTVFIFTGSGFAPTELALTKNGGPAGSHTVDVEDDDAWEVPVRSRPGDEGRWSAELSSAACSATVEFRVTLTNTDAASDALGGTSPTAVTAALLMLVVAGLGGGLMLGRKLESRTRADRAL